MICDVKQLNQGKPVQIFFPAWYVIAPNNQSEKKLSRMQLNTSECVFGSELWKDVSWVSDEAWAGRLRLHNSIHLN